MLNTLSLIGSERAAKPTASCSVLSFDKRWSLSGEQQFMSFGIRLRGLACCILIFINISKGDHHVASTAGIECSEPAGIN